MYKFFMVPTEQQAYNKGVISFFSFLFTALVTAFLLGDYLGYFRVTDLLKTYIYVSIVIIEYIFTFLLKGNPIGVNIFFAVTFITGGIVIPFKMLETIPAIYVYAFYILSSILILVKTQNIQYKLAEQWNKRKIDVIMGALLFIMLPSIFSHLAAFVASTDRSKK